MGLFGVDVAGCEALAASCVGPIGASAIGSFFFVAGEGVSTNMIEGPGASCAATAVRGVGLEVNLGEAFSFFEGGWINLPCDDEDSCDVELATLRVSFALLPDFETAVSDAIAPGRGLKGVTDSTVGLSGSIELLFGEPEPCALFQIDFLRSSFREKKGNPDPAVIVCALLMSDPGRLRIGPSLSSEDASRSYSSKLLPLIAASLSEAKASSSASSSSASEVT